MNWEEGKVLELNKELGEDEKILRILKKIGNLKKNIQS